MYFIRDKLKHRMDSASGSSDVTLETAFSQKYLYTLVAPIAVTGIIVLIFYLLYKGKNKPSFLQSKSDATKYSNMIYLYIALLYVVLVMVMVLMATYGLFGNASA